MHSAAAGAGDKGGSGVHRGAVLAVAAAVIGLMTTLSGVVIELASDLLADMRHGVCVERVPGDTRPLYHTSVLGWRPYDRTRCCGGSAFVDHASQECKTRSIISMTARKHIAAPSAAALPFGWEADEPEAAAVRLGLSAKAVALSTAAARQVSKAAGGASAHLGTDGQAAGSQDSDEASSQESEWRSWGRWLGRVGSHGHRERATHLRERVGSDAADVRSHISHAFSSDAAEGWGEEAVDRFTSLAEQAELAVNADAVQTHSESAGSLAPFYEWVPWDRALPWTGRSVAMAIHVFGCGCFALCAALITRWQVPAKGSGIPEVKAAVAGFAIPKSFEARTLAAKVMALSLCVGAGLAVGKEGPMIHIGACWGVLLAGPISRVARLAVPIDETELICVGAAAGVSAAFGAPLGGVLFALEELGSAMPSGLKNSTMLVAFGSAVVAALTLKWMDLTHTQRLTLLEVDYKETWAPWEALPFCLLGAIGGLVGGSFVLLNGAVQRRRLRAQAEGRLHWSLRADVDAALRKALGLRGVDTRVLEVLVLAILTGVSNYPHVLTRILQGDAIKAMFSQCPASSQQPVDGELDPDQLPYDDPTGLCGIRSAAALTSLLQLLFSSAALRFAQAAVTFGALTPAGLFVPSLFVGGCIGRAFGAVLRFASLTSGRGLVEPGIYAMVGAGAVLAGVSRITLSLVVILFELTGGLTYVVPFMLAVLTAKWTADAMTNNLSVYDIHTELNGYAIVEQVEEVRLPNVTLRDLCDKVPAHAGAGDAEPAMASLAEDGLAVRAPVPLWAVGGAARGVDLQARRGETGFPVLSLTSRGEVEILGWVHAHRLSLALRAAEAAAEVGKLDAGPSGNAAQLLFQLAPAGAQRCCGPPGSQRPGEQAVDFSGVLERRGVVRVRADCPLQTIYCIFETCPHVQAVVSVEEGPLAARALTRSLFLSHVMPAAERPRAPAAVWPAQGRGAECGGAAVCAA